MLPTDNTADTPERDDVEELVIPASLMLVRLPAELLAPLPEHKQSKVHARKYGPATPLQRQEKRRQLAGIGRRWSR
jgi:hypothetical protein